MAARFPEGMHVDQAEAWFGTKTAGRFNQNGAISQLWLTLDRYPTLEAIEQDGEAEFYRFADGTVIRRAAGVAPQVLGSAAASRDQLETWFGTKTTGRFNPDGSVSRLWLGLGRFPTLEAIDKDGGADFYRFADGTVICRAGDAAPRILASDGASAAQLETWFAGNFNPAGPVSLLWLTLGRFPRLVERDEANHRPAQYYRFADGTVIWRPDPGAPPRRMAPAKDRLSLSAIWNDPTDWTPAKDALLSQEFGQTDFAINNPGLYNYSLAYCRDWCPDSQSAANCGIGHPGLDVGADLGVPFGTPLLTPVAGTVVCAGTGIGGDDASPGCGFFECIPQPGQQRGPHQGRFELRLENGDRLIFGHMQEVTVQAGQQLKAGDAVGFSGGENGDHVHIEYREKDDQCGADVHYLLADPRRKFD
jgi:murein DD-endopeptidase MepM/ murein hydrolase activator NlpD